MKVKDIYDYLNEYAPFSVQDKYDNSGFLVGDINAKVKGICLCLDITMDVIKEAAAHRANLIISHHPVIFDPLKSVTEGSPVYELVKNKINAICMHTNADMTKDGVSDLMLDLLEFEQSNEVLEPIMPNNTGYGKICTLAIETHAKALAEYCKKAFDCTVVRYTETDKPIKRVAICSGSGGSTLPLAIKAGCDALITGDIKHDVWVDAVNSDFCLIDAGHFHTENILCNHLCGILSRKFNDTQIFVAQSSKDPCSYIV